MDVAAKKPKHATKVLKLGSSTLTVAAGATAPVKGKLSKKGAKLLKRAGKIKKASITLSVKVPGGEAASATISGTLVAKNG